MKLHLLGTGTPILDRGRPATTALLIEVGPEKIVFDTGRGVTGQLLQQNITPVDVDTVFITHHHYDHIADLGEFLLSAWHNGRTKPIHVWGPSGTAQIVAALFDQVYARDIAFALFNEPDAVDIRQLVKVVDVGPGVVYESDTWRVVAEYVNHGNSLGLSTIEWPCLGYRLEAEGKAITIGGDTVACEGLDRLARDADVLVMACYLADQEIDNPAFERLVTHVIASSGQVGQIAAQAGVRMLVLTHFRKKSAALMRSLTDDVRANFSGELIIGHDLMMIEV
ncbi:MAG: MBL fold metallo-hydrolase [Anaerolineae bacterium]|nr:MBL fold metallo-hydrolase [Anaerolineae bacterium]